MMNRTRPSTAGTLAMKKVAAMHCTVKSRRKGIRRPPRSDRAPRIGDTIALMPTLTATDTASNTPPSRRPNWSVRYSPMAPDTTAKLKIVLAKSYRAHDAGTMARPLGVRAPRPRARFAGPTDGAALATLG